ncbi:hypothetical protein J6Q66_01940 [bacterium]|nr:hypothetical protein [bacterium]
MGLNAVLQLLQRSQVIRQADDIVGIGARNWQKPSLVGLRYAPNTRVDKFVSKLDSITRFSTKEEIVQYFKNLGVDVRIEEFTPKHLETFNLIRDDVELLRRMGLKEAVPKGICLSDWRNTEKTKALITEYGLDMHFPAERRAYCGANSNTVFINSSDEALEASNGVFRKFKHEIGHRRHYTHYNSKGVLGSNGTYSVLGKGLNDNVSFANRQLEVLGINAKVFKIPNYSMQYQVTAPVNGKFIPLEGNRVLNVDVSKMTAYMNGKCHCYNKEYLSEQVAEIFEDLLKGRRYDDLTMLMYDFAGGGRIPNLIINGQKYDDYIKSLYENKELVNKLKEFIEISCR